MRCCTPCTANAATAKKDAEAALAQLKAGADFAEIARKQSDDPGWVLDFVDKLGQDDPLTGRNANLRVKPLVLAH